MHPAIGRQTLTPMLRGWLQYFRLGAKGVRVRYQDTTKIAVSPPLEPVERARMRRKHWMQRGLDRKLAWWLASTAMALGGDAGASHMNDAYRAAFRATRSAILIGLHISIVLDKMPWTVRGASGRGLVLPDFRTWLATYTEIICNGRHKHGG